MKLQPANMTEANFSLCVTKHYAMKAYGEVDAKINVFLTSALVELSGQLQTPAVSSSGKEAPGTHFTGPQSPFGRHG
jgi:hypothetical protein